MESPHSPLTLSTAVQFLKGVGPKRAEQLAALGLKTAGDLLTYYPRDYVRYSGETSVTQLVPGEVATVRGTLLQTRMMPRRGRAPARFEGLLEEERPADSKEDVAPGRCVLTWFSPYGLAEKLFPGVRLRVVGKVTIYNNRPQMAQPQYEILDAEADPPPAGAKIEPKYPATEELSLIHI